MRKEILMVVLGALLLPFVAVPASASGLNCEAHECDDTGRSTCEDLSEAEMLCETEEMSANSSCWTEWGTGRRSEVFTDENSFFLTAHTECPNGSVLSVTRVADDNQKLAAGPNYVRVTIAGVGSTTWYCHGACTGGQCAGS